jgi:lycopene beta-cyclase
MVATYDYVLVGVGLQNTLVVLALAALRPGARVALVEREASPYGSHTWCFHAGDLSEAARAIVEPAVAVEWPRYAVRFPGQERQLEQPYAAVTVSSLRAAMRAALGKLRVDEFFGQAAVEVGEHLVCLADGRELSGTLVIDARGPSTSDVSVAGFQKFVGYELELARPARFTPMVMDATVEQLDGFRFMYALPLAPVPRARGRHLLFALEQPRCGGARHAHPRLRGRARARGGAHPAQ